MINKRKAIAISLVLVLIPSYAAYAKKKTLTFWNYNEGQWQVVIKRFMAGNQNVEVKLISGDQDKFYTMIAAGDMPDIWGPWSTPGIRADVNRNWIVPLDSYIKRDSKEIKYDDFFPGMMKQFKIAGKQYSLPEFCYVDYYFYNTKLYAQAGLVPPTLDAGDKSWNWDKMISNAKKLTKYNSQGKITTAGLSLPLNGQDPNYYLMWDASLYGEEALRTSVPQKVYWTDPKMVNALTKVWETINKNKVAFPTDGGFESAKAASSIASGPNINTYMHAKKLDWAIAPLPWAITNSGTLWTDGWRISKMCKDKELAWKFVKFLARPDIMRYLVSDPKSVRLGTPAARKSVFSETLGKDIGKVTGMKPDDVLKVHSEMDESGVLKRHETICIHMDLLPFWAPIRQNLWDNKISPVQAAQKLQDVTNRQLPILFQRWIRNTKYTGVEKRK